MEGERNVALQYLDSLLVCTFYGTNIFALHNFQTHINQSSGRCILLKAYINIPHYLLCVCVASHSSLLLFIRDN